MDKVSVSPIQTPSIVTNTRDNKFRVQRFPFALSGFIPMFELNSRSQKKRPLCEVVLLVQVPL
jgi:hypothetical protein